MKYPGLSVAEPWQVVAAGYAETTMPLFHGFADYALDMISLNQESVILDLACGPGTLGLRAAPKVRAVHGLDFSENMVDIFRNNIESMGLKNVNVKVGDGQELQYPEAFFDAVFSLFGLMFFPDRNKSYSGIYRCLKPGGKLLVASWAPASDSQAMKVLLGLLKAIDPNTPDLVPELESLENKQYFQKELEAAGFSEVEVVPVFMKFPFLSVREFWASTVKGAVPIVMMKKRLSEKEWREKEALALYFLENEISVETKFLEAKAWFGTGRK